MADLWVRLQGLRAEVLLDSGVVEDEEGPVGVDLLLVTVTRLRQCQSVEIVDSDIVTLLRIEVKEPTVALGGFALDIGHGNLPSSCALVNASR